MSYDEYDLAIALVIKITSGLMTMMRRLWLLLLPACVHHTHITNASADVSIRHDSDDLLIGMTLRPRMLSEMTDLSMSIYETMRTKPAK